MKKRIKKLYLQQKKRNLKKILGTPEKPRLSIFRSHNHIYGQVIDDKNSKTLVSCSTIDKELRSIFISKSTSNLEAAFIIGNELAKRALKKEINSIIFDRGSKPYQGRIKNLAEGARKEGLIF
jgi:large subunit ribosomal protein L18